MGPHTVTQTIPSLLLITDPTLGQHLPQQVTAALRGGVKHLLLRHKQATAGEMLRLAQEMQSLTRAYRAALLIHDRLDIALAVAADGVHLPEHGLPTAIARTLWPGLLGRSCHSVESARQALQEGADYVTLSPLFATSSHPEATPLGLERFRSWRQQIHGPVLALGGIHKENAHLARAAGADGVAMIRGLLA
ncbi:thiamine phosphate synthase, partial [Candidatus Magnetaquicoccus inordinatus]|uniref:thiamine phosphate synthase n=1 Tax=Candidatus Magnetaquicoccus inordinatus TaxID=2496818 RepID=UPI00102B6DBA